MSGPTQSRVLYLLQSHTQIVHPSPLSSLSLQVRDLVLLASADGRRPHVYLPQDCRPHADKFISVLIERVRVLLFFPVESTISQNGGSISSSSGDAAQVVATAAAVQDTASASYTRTNKSLTTQAAPQPQQQQAKESTPGQESGTNIEYIDRYEDLIDSDEETTSDRPDIYLSRMRKLR